ncbi:MAG: L-threonylcarbamoyladenylate synthase [Sedimentisphaerales bacterium]
MRTTILKINDPAALSKGKVSPKADDIEKLKQAADCIGQGGLVVFPTETVYGIACKADQKSLAKLDELKKRDIDKRYTLHIGDKNKLADFVPTLTPPARKLVENAWPGPVTIVFEIDPKDINLLKKQFGEKTVELLYKDNAIGIRCPENDIARELLNLCKFPVVAPSANIAGKEPATNAEQAIEQFTSPAKQGGLSGIVDMVLDGGQCKYKKSSTVVKISANGWEIIREGIYSEQQIRKMLTVNILFVCTGNTCRSPMAEGFTKKLLAKKLRTNIDRLEYIGYKVTSAGIMAYDGIGASPESIRFCNSKGVNITSHLTQRLTSEMIGQADYIFVMSEGHRNDIIRLFPAVAKRCMLLSDSGEIEDPIGRGFEVYKEVGEIIEKAVNKRIGELLK